MKPTCPHWRDAGNPEGGECAIVKVHHPSFGTCNRCDHPENNWRGQMPGHVPDKLVQVRVPTAAEQAAAEAAQLIKYHSLWLEIHSLALTGISDEYLNKLAPRLPCGKCRYHLRVVREASPLPSDPAEHFRWSVGLHNVVNAIKGKPLLSVDDARARYTAAPPG